MILKKRYFVRKDRVADIQRMVGGFLAAYPLLWPDNAKLEVLETDKDVSFIVIDRVPVFFQKDGRYYPTLKAVLGLDLLRKTVVVDEGAVRFVVNGADIMRPGVVEFDKSIEKDDTVVVLEVKHRKPLAIGTSLLDAEGFGREKTGKVVKNVHFVGDHIWEALEKI